ncbi:AidA/PixA family protein [Photorhabdus antumapuensis]|uniref:AidA/PixA family protein n=1 Tax=Photorhabdus antumapuensis TaxID=2862867 RepID=UPI001CED62BD|nr:AidA/PixA family protein [Photorhabdus antumapuensis]MCA6222052.1 inclusion body family protein [Photorhabdus antumapuensis]
MNETVDVIICVDVDCIINDYKKLGANPDNPTMVDNKYFHYITNNENADIPENNATGELIVKMGVNDIIRWRVISLTQQLIYSVNLYKKTKENSYRIITPLKYTQEVTKVLYPEQDDKQVPGTPFKHGVESITQSYLESKGKQSGEEKLTFIISIHNNIELIGYISHSAFVRVL